MSIAFQSRLALRYVQVADLIRQRIARGVWPEEHQLPTLEALVREFGVARVTVRQAIKLLAEEGLLSPQQGRGTFVTRRPSQERFISVFTTLSELSRAYEDTRPEVVNIEEGAHAPSFLEHGAGRQAERYTFMRRVHHRDGHPYCVINIYIDEKIFRRSPKRFRTEVVIPLLTSLPRLKIAEAHQVLTIGAADIEVARLLELPVNAPVAEVRRVFKDDKGTVIYVAHATYRGDAIRLEMDLKP
jgi:GntR family transcriptional regulator